MTESSCRDFRENPEEFNKHPEGCAACAALLEESSELEMKIREGLGSPELRTLSLNSRELPVAPWEGASERAWPLAVLGALALVFMAVILFLLSGISPTEGFRAVVVSQLPRFEMFEVAAVVGEGLRAAPPGVHLLILAAFIIVNLVFLRLLRRAPRGVDASSR